MNIYKKDSGRNSNNDVNYNVERNWVHRRVTASHFAERYWLKGVYPFDSVKKWIIYFLHVFIDWCCRNIIKQVWCKNSKNWRSYRHLSETIQIAQGGGLTDRSGTTFFITVALKTRATFNQFTSNFARRIVTTFHIVLRGLFIFRFPVYYL